MPIVPGFCGIAMTWGDVRYENVFRDCAIESIRAALHKSALRNPNGNPGSIAAAHKKTAGGAGDRGQSSVVRNAYPNPLNVF